MPMRVIQWLQVRIQNILLSAVLRSNARPKPPFATKLMRRFSVLQRLPARIVGLGISRSTCTRRGFLGIAGSAKARKRHAHHRRHRCVHCACPPCNG